MKERAPAVYRWIETMLRPPITDPETWDVPPEYFSIDALPDTLLNFLKLIGQNFVPEVKATVDLYNGWLEAEDRTAGTIIDVEGQKRCHQVLGPLEHVQMGVAIKRIGLLDDVSHHARSQSVTDQMSAVEMDSLRRLLKDTRMKDLADLRLKRDLERQDYAGYSSSVSHTLNTCAGPRGP